MTPACHVPRARSRLLLVMMLAQTVRKGIQQSALAMMLSPLVQYVTVAGTAQLATVRGATRAVPNVIQIPQVVVIQLLVNVTKAIHLPTMMA